MAVKTVVFVAEKILNKQFLSHQGHVDFCLLLLLSTGFAFSFFEKNIKTIGESTIQHCFFFLLTTIHFSLQKYFLDFKINKLSTNSTEY